MGSFRARCRQRACNGPSQAFGADELGLPAHFINLSFTRRRRGGLAYAAPPSGDYRKKMRTRKAPPGTAGLYANFLVLTIRY